MSWLKLVNFLVTGGGGFIGSHLIEKLVKQGDDVTVIDNFTTGKKENLVKVINKIHLYEGSINDFDLLKSLIKGKDGIFHQAALASVQESFARPQEYQMVNVEGTKNILQLAKEFSVKIVYASSSSVYGNPVKIPIQEDDPKNPINPYAQTKLDDEHLASEYAKNGVRVIGLRYFNVFGERQSEQYAGVIKKFVKRVRNNEPPTIYGDGSQTRDFVYVGDVVRANILAMKSNVDHSFFNIGTNTSISVLDLANLIVSAFGSKLKPIHAPSLPGDVQVTQADISHAKKMLGWEPKTEIRQWLQDTIAAKTNLDSITN
jgi:nucleoside-diphosphate-sugar epimerase